MITDRGRPLASLGTRSPRSAVNSFTKAFIRFINGGHLNMNSIRDHFWYPALQKAKLRRRVFYQTRHTIASNALAAGEDPAWVVRMPGHRTLGILFETYARFIPHRTKRDGAALAHATLVGRTRRNPDFIPKAS